MAARALGVAVTARRQDEEAVVLAAPRGLRGHRAGQQRRVRERRLPRDGLVAATAVARERRDIRIGRAVVVRVGPRQVVLRAVAGVAVDREVGVRALALPLVAGGALDEGVLAGERHPRPAVLLERRGVGPRRRRVALEARAIHPTGMRVLVAALAAPPRLAAIRMTAAAAGLDVRVAQRKPGAVVIEAAGAGGGGELPAVDRVARRAIHVLDEVVVGLGLAVPHGLAGWIGVDVTAPAEPHDERDEDRDHHPDADPHPRERHGASVCGFA